MTREQAIAEITSRLVAFYDPLRVYLIGSSARGDAREDSDLDFLVVVPDSTPPSQRLYGHGGAGGIHRALWEVPFSVDVVPFRESAFRERAGWLMSLPAIALREGKLLYDSAIAR